MNFKLKCLTCDSITNLYFPDKCFDCRNEESKNDTLLIELKKQDKRKERKAFFYHTSFYLFTCFLLYYFFSFSIEIAFIAGTIFVSLLKIAVDWFTDIF